MQLMAGNIPMPAGGVEGEDELEEGEGEQVIELTA